MNILRRNRPTVRCVPKVVSATYDTFVGDSEFVCVKVVPNLRLSNDFNLFPVYIENYVSGMYISKEFESVRSWNQSSKTKTLSRSRSPSAHYFVFFSSMEIISPNARTVGSFFKRIHTLFNTAKLPNNSIAFSLYHLAASVSQSNLLLNFFPEGSFM